MTLTNIACKIIITLLTNSVESDNASGCKECNGVMPPDTVWLAIPNYVPPHLNCKPYVTPTERTVTTTITERTEVQWPGPDQIRFHRINEDGTIMISNAAETKSISQDRIIFTETKRYRRSEQWVEVKPEPPVTFHTNQFRAIQNGYIWLHADTTNWHTITNR